MRFVLLAVGKDRRAKRAGSNPRRKIPATDLLTSYACLNKLDRQTDLHTDEETSLYLNVCSRRHTCRQSLQSYVLNSIQLYNIHRKCAGLFNVHMQLSQTGLSITDWIMQTDRQMDTLTNRLCLQVNKNMYSIHLHGRNTTLETNLFCSLD